MADRSALRRARRFLALLSRDRKGATAIEYGLILALVVLGLMTALTGLGGQNQLSWTGIHDKVKAVTPN